MPDPLPDPFLRTRIAVPVTPGTYLRRPRLLHRLDGALRTPLTLVEGPAGGGKTLLTADWVAGLDGPVAWLTVEPGDNRPGVFWSYVLKALGSCGALRSGDLPADASRMTGGLPARLAAALEARERPVVLVLDDFDRVGAPEVAEQLEFVLRHAGRGLRLVLVTRTEPLLPLHRYRAAGEVTEIRAAELAFTPEETVDLLHLHGLTLPVAAARALVDRTRGWAAGLRLSALAATRSADPEVYLKEFEAGHSAIADFLLAEVLEGCAERTQDLLLRVSVLERFCPELANALTGRVDAEPLLVALHRANAFVEDLGHTWYRLHPLFREILRAHLRVRLPGLEPELHLRAARWLRRSGHTAEAVAHGAAAGAWDFAADAVVDDLAIGRLMAGPRAGDPDGPFAGMGPERGSPARDLVRAALRLARNDLSRHDLDDALLHLRRAGERQPDGDRASAAARLSRAAVEALAARRTGDPSRAGAALDAAERAARDVPARLLEERPEVLALLRAHAGAAYLWAGRFEEARAALTPVARAAQGSPCGAVAKEEALAHLALLDHLTGWLGRAEQKALAAVSEEERAGLPRESGSGLGRLVLAAVALDRRETERARHLLDGGARAGAEGPPDPVPEALRALVTARLLLADGKPRAAAEAARRPVPAEAPSPWAEGHAALVVAAARLAEGRADAAAEAVRDLTGDRPLCATEAAGVHLAAGRPEDAVALLDTVRAGSGAGPAVAVRALLVRAGAARRAGDEDAARKLVERALLDARRERLRGPFRDAGAWLRPLLAAPPLRELAAGWLTPDAPRPDGRTVPTTPVELAAAELSGRERDVLERLAGMMSAEEIAADLHVSVNTVKSHLKSAYRKLAVNRRGDAVRRARALGLL
ncbi:LuxR C-terminal-related transcriptional regulator [Streptomyces sp. NPDC005012]|uniref:LuxR C-terminal-related transcriptional regulator n=1 Tax=Streptomyces sp. NPDC005012 TaxID=3154558 RepID=UPI0033A1DB33